jgi:tetratricopeptide (TPR) repeat protein
VQPYPSPSASEPATTSPEEAPRPDGACDWSALTPPQQCYERGLTFAAMGNASSAIDIFRRATRLQPDMVPAWRKLVELLRFQGDSRAATVARESQRAAEALGTYRHHTLSPPSAEQLAAAEHRWAELLKSVPKETASGLFSMQLGGSAPTDVVAMTGLATRVKEDRQRQALLCRAVGLAPGFLPARRELSMLLFNRGEFARALPHFELLYEREPENVMCRAFLAVCQGKVGNYARAIELYEECGDAFDAEPGFFLDYAEALKYAGRGEDCVTILSAVLDDEPGNGMAWCVLADMKTAPFSAADIATMQSQLAIADIPVDLRVRLNYALGRAFEQQGKFAESFAHYARGAAVRRKQLKYDDGGPRRMTVRMKRFFTAARFAATAGTGCPDPAPIFILGMPRAGSTLVEQILASHSSVEGTMELPEIANIVRDIGTMATGFRYPECLAEYDATELAELGQRYIDRTRIFRRTARPFFIDKRPANWAQIGLIHMILPNAKIIDVRRNPIANCFAAFKQYFGRGAEYSYGLTDVGNYYNMSLDRMANFDEVVPGRVHRVLYENLVNDTETEIRRLLDYCGLPFEPACLRFWETKRAVATPSAEQVRQPVYRDSLEQWRDYEPWLDELKRTLTAPGTPRWDR